MVGWRAKTDAESGSEGNPVAEVWRALGNPVKALLSSNASAANTAPAPEIKPMSAMSGITPSDVAENSGQPNQSLPSQEGDAKSSGSPGMNGTGDQQSVDQQKSIEEQRRQWEFDKGIDSSLRRGRVWPSTGRINSDYDLKRPHPVYEGQVKPHRALDIRNPNGGQVMSAGGGTVRSVGNSGDLGNHVIIDYDNGLRGVYGHTAPSVGPGQKVRAGDPVGNTDLSGATTGPHIHYEVHDPQTGEKLNPRDHLPHRLE